MSHAVLAVERTNPMWIKPKTPIFFELWSEQRPPGISFTEEDYDVVPESKHAAPADEKGE